MRSRRPAPVAGRPRRKPRKRRVDPGSRRHKAGQSGIVEQQVVGVTLAVIENTLALAHFRISTQADA